MGGCHTPQGRSPRGNAGQPWSHRVVVATLRAKGVKRNDEVVGQTFFFEKWIPNRQSFHLSRRHAVRVDAGP